jgi:hypothetical protein
MTLKDDVREIPALFGDAVEQLGKLVQNEAQLAKAEISEKVSHAMRGVAMLAAAAMFVGPVLVMLLIARAMFLHRAGLSEPLAFLVSAVVGGLLAAILMLVGKSYLKPEALTPTVTLREVKADIGTAKELVR